VSQTETAPVTKPSTSVTSIGSRRVSEPAMSATDAAAPSPMRTLRMANPSSPMFWSLGPFREDTPTYGRYDQNIRLMRVVIRLLYEIAYRVGFVPWDTGAPPAELVAAVEGPNRLAPGRALDLGCGTGTNVVYLCRHGWQVTGVDMVGRALSLAR